MDLIRLRSFVDASRLGSFAAAAQALGYTAPAVSQHVAQLERELGCELLIRGARGVTPTDPGTVLLARAERLLADAKLIELAVREAAGQLRTLRVGAFPSVALQLLPDALGQLLADHDDLELTLTHFEPPDGLDQLVAGDMDVVIAHRYPGVNWSAPTGVRLTRILSDPMEVILPTDHALAGRTSIEIGELRDEVFISGPPLGHNRIALVGACAAAGFAPKISFETMDYAVTPALVAKGFGIAMLPRIGGATAGLPVARVPLFVGGETLARGIELATRTGPHSPLVAELQRHLTAQ